MLSHMPTNPKPWEITRRPCIVLWWAHVCIFRMKFRHSILCKALVFFLEKPYCPGMGQPWSFDRILYGHVDSTQNVRDVLNAQDLMCGVLVVLSPSRMIRTN